MDLIKALLNVPAISEVPVDQLQWLLDHSSCQTFEPGDHLFSRGDPIDKMQVILEGKFTVKVEQNGEFKKIIDIESNEISGTLPYSRATSAIGFAMAVEPSRVISLHKEHFREMICDHHELTTALVHTMTTRVREFTKLQQQQEKMMSLGKLSAGLAHELNNPSSAMARSAKELKNHLGALPEKFKRVISIKMTEDQVDTVNGILFSKIEEAQNKTISLTERTEQEDEIADWLEDHGFEDGYENAPVFVEFGLTTDDFDEILDHVPEEDLRPVLEWIHNVLITENLVNDIESAAVRISDLVTSVKSYTHMDRGTEMEPLNVIEGIENTIKMLNHKMRQKQIESNINFSEALPLIEGRVGSLNQVWTNVIDNAIDAMDQGGKLTVTVDKDGPQVMVCIQDNGKGIPEDLQSKIFDPFFTTKKVGEGTGMGLDIVSRIIRNHKGEIKLRSEPGNTKFMFYFPISDN